MANPLILCIGFDCNNDCQICMLKDIRKKMNPLSFDKYKEILNKNINNYDSLILSGGEITVNPDLIDFIKYAKSLGNIKNIQIQTNGRKLSDYDYSKSLMDAGVNEFFISLYGSNPEIHNTITRVRGSFEETIKGIENIDKHNARIITNTVINSLNYSDLPNIVDILLKFKNIKEMQFWNYLPMKSFDESNLISSNKSTKHFLFQAIKIAISNNISVKVKYFPECLMENYSIYLDNAQPELMIDELFWNEYNKNIFDNCIYRSICSSKKCNGLTRAYINKFGWDENILKPFNNKY